MTNARQLIRFAAIIVGSVLIIDTLTSLSFLYTDATASDLNGSDYLVVGLAPLLGSIFAALIIYGFASRCELTESTSQVSVILEGGIKLIGIYLTIKAIPYIFLTFSAIQLDEPLWNTLGKGAMYFVLGVAFIARTNKIVSLVNRDAGV